MPDAKPLTREAIAELHREPAFWHLADYRVIDATVRAAEARIEALRAALVEIMSPPDESKGEGYGCASLHEAQWIAATAHTEDNVKASGDYSVTRTPESAGTE